MLNLLYNCNRKMLRILLVLLLQNLFRRAIRLKKMELKVVLSALLRMLTCDLLAVMQYYATIVPVQYGIWSRESQSVRFVESMET